MLEREWVWVHSNLSSESIPIPKEINDSQFAEIFVRQDLQEKGMQFASLKSIKKQHLWIKKTKFCYSAISSFHPRLVP